MEAGLLDAVLAARTSARAGRRNGELAITGIIETVLRRAHSRHLANIAFEYLAVAGVVGAAGAIALLILGRQVLDWYWPVLLFLAALCTGLVRARHRLLSRYRLAQVVDERLGLQDRLSTVVYFRQQAAPADLIRTVESQAVQRLSTEDVRSAVPIVFPRYGYACGALLMAAGGLLGLRYGVLHTMDLRPPLADIQFAPTQPEPKAYATAKKSAIQERWEQQLKELGITREDLERPDETGAKTKEQEVQAVADDPTAAAADKNGKKDMKAPSPDGGEDSQGGEQSEGQKSDSSNSDSASEQKGQPSKKQDNAPQNAKQGQAGSQDGLMNKMRDALANLMNKLKNQDKQQDGSQQQNASNNGQQQQGQMGKQQQQGQQGRQQGEGQPGADQQSGEQNGEKMAGNKSNSAEKSDHPGDQNSKSGVGQQDGEKAIREAQQLAAMGKISEIFGKRAQQLTGEISVEVSSGKQQLKTQWSERKALHADTGAETNRNEIPLAYQAYVQRYFEEVRKSAATSKSPKPQAHP